MPKLPAYQELLAAGELKKRVEAARDTLTPCIACPRACRVDRKGDEIGVCRVGRWARVASAFPHFGEERVLRGTRGSGTVFFSGCNLRCVFCQNWEISQRPAGRELAPEELAELFLWLEQRGVHNLNLVTPEHVVPQALEALYLAAKKGLRLPLVYNTSAYDSLESLRLLDGVVHIYMPDFKLWTREAARRYLGAADYPERAREAFREMHRQVGDLVVGREGLAERGMLVRHLVMPGMLEETKAILKFLAGEISKDTYLNLMDQYYPAYKAAAGKYPELARPLFRWEYEEALRYARTLGLWRFAD